MNRHLVRSIVLAIALLAAHPGMARVAHIQVAHTQVAPIQVAHARSAPPVITRPTVWLTFDDGPDPKWTIKVLATLRAFRISGTFFEVGRQVARYPSIARAIHAVGMPIQDHTWSHPYLPSLSASQQRIQLIDQMRALRVLKLPLPHWFRPPYGAYTQQTIRIAAALGLRMLLWTVDPRDWSRPGTSAIINRVLTHTNPGSVILFHDGGGNRSQTLAALPTIIRSLLARGYQFGTFA